MTDHTNTNAEGLDARGRIEEARDGVLDRGTLDVLLKEVLAVTKQARGWCPNCKKAVHVDIPDSKAVVSAMGELLTQAKGRPAQEAQDDEHVTVNYYVVLRGEGSEDKVTHDGAELDSDGAARVIEGLDFPEGATGASSVIETGATG
jgi:hypothetical protein